MSTKKTLIFDFNGTMFFDTEMHYRAWDEFMPRRLGRRLPREELDRNIIGQANVDIFRRYFGDISPEQIEELTMEKEAEYRRQCLLDPDRFHLVEGLVEFLDELKAEGFTMTIATGSPLVNLNFYMEHFRLDRWFSAAQIIYDDGTYPGKPAPDIYRLAAKKIGLDPSECLVFEDGTSGIRAANAANAGAVVVVYQEKYQSPLTEQTKVDRVFHDHLAWRQTLADYGILR